MSERLFDNPVIDRQSLLASSAEDLAERGAGFAGDQRIYRFANGYGASLIQLCVTSTDPGMCMFCTGEDPETGGPLWEICVIKFLSDDDTDFELMHDTPVADGVIRVTEEEAEQILQRIKELPDDTGAG